MTAIKPPDTAPSSTEFSGTGTIRNPANGAIAGEVQWTDPADVPGIAARLRAAQREWEQRGADGRAKVLARFAIWMGEHRDEIEELLIKETGKSATDAAQEVPMLIMVLSYYIRTMAKALEPESGRRHCLSWRSRRLPCTTGRGPSWASLRRGTTRWPTR
jgi:acyl-CoA reductase-like NAD-dependent aldehyde dehydrogenase